ncbi:MAG: transglycosylase domain-containing protein [Candidatus Liptonbacteria bacterium]|nr:transglycosylase domain-containing protein [Candidatus Liptonbacteria bacterium]
MRLTRERSPEGIRHKLRLFGHRLSTPPENTSSLVGSAAPKRERPRKPGRRARRIWLWLVLVVGVIAVLALIWVALLLQDLPSTEQILSRRVSQSTKIYDRTGQVVLYEIGGDQKRTVISGEEIPQSLKNATIAAEDERFYSDSAIDYRGLLRALWTNLRSGRVVQGGSTITQQLAKNAFLTSDQTLTRKIREVFLAIRLARNYTKDQILAMYLNEIPYGPTIYGVEGAGQLYFGKPARDLSLAESAVLAALPKAPSRLAPGGSHQDELIARQRTILRKMNRLGMISAEELEVALNAKLSFVPPTHGIKAPHFVFWVQDYLIERYGEELVRSGGLRVITTLDWEMQQAAEKAVREGAERNQKLYQGRNAALVAEDPRTGQVLALVGSRDYFDLEHNGNFNVAAQGLRQPGSTLKPFVYLTAFQKGYSPDSVVFDVPTEFVARDPDCPPEPVFEIESPTCFHPQNFDDSFLGPVPFRRALAQSRNIPAVKVLYLVGFKDALTNATRFGLTTLTNPAEYGLSLVLGGGAVRLVNLVEAYSVLAGDGVRHAQGSILEVKDSSGAILETYRDSAERVAEAQPVRLVNNILTDLDARSGLFHSSLALTTIPGHDIAIKTGTSNDYRDAWVVGYSSALVVGVWAGNNNNQPMQRQGSSLLAAVPIWHSFAVEAFPRVPPEKFPAPEPVARSDKPMFSGQVVSNNQIHSLLYYVNRTDPTGPAPERPERDPQFYNWEMGVLLWAQKNVPALVAGNNATSSPQISFASPANGSSFVDSINLTASVASATPLKRISISFNGVLIQEVAPESPGPYQINWSFVPANPQPQNILEIEARNASSTSREGIILYH